MKRFTPVNQKRLTNVVVVRLKRAGKRFEVACYPNKVLPWRNKIEKDIDEVLQTHTVFTNVSKGQLSKKEDLVAAFGTDDQEKICLEILSKGELQVSGRERSCQLDAQYRDIATIVANRCVNPETNRPYTVTLIEQAMRDQHFSVNPNQSSKKQALDVIRLLTENAAFPIRRAQMKIRLSFSQRNCADKNRAMALRQQIIDNCSNVEQDSSEDDLIELVIALDPGRFRQIDQLLKSECRGRANIQVLSLNDVQDGDEVLE